MYNPYLDDTVNMSSPLQMHLANDEPLTTKLTANRELQLFKILMNILIRIVIGLLITTLHQLNAFSNLHFLIESLICIRK